MVGDDAGSPTTLPVIVPAAVAAIPVRILTTVRTPVRPVRLVRVVRPVRPVRMDTTDFPSAPWSPLAGSVLMLPFTK